MLYLIETVYYEKETGKVLDLLKIGYTKDDPKTISGRFIAYKLHNPGCKILYKIPGLTDRDEKAIQKKFENFIYPDYGREWFNWDQSIIDFFKELSMSEDCRGILDKLIYVSKNPARVLLSGKTHKETSEIRKLFRIYINIFLTEWKDAGKEKVDEIICDMFSNNISDLSGLHSYLESVFPEEYVGFKKKSETLDIDENLKNLILEYYSTDIKNKYEILCTNEKEIVDKILDYIPEFSEVRANYILIGPEKLKSMCYSKTLIDKYLARVNFDKSKLKDEIFYNFSVDDLLPLSKIKETISAIYEKVGYKKSAMALDITEYFNVLESSLRRDLKGTGEKKRVKYYKLLSVKPEYQEDYDRVKGIISPVKKDC